MAPEIMEGEKYYDDRIDVYSLGMMILFMLTGEPIMMSVKIEKKILKSVIKKLQKENINKKFIDLIYSMLRAKKEKRKRMIRVKEQFQQIKGIAMLKKK